MILKEYVFKHKTFGGVLSVYAVKVVQSFDAAHFLSGYEGKCSNIHGHRWLVEAEIKSETLTAEGQLKGMVADFSDVKKALKAEADYFDHALIVESGSLKHETMEAIKAEDFKIIEVGFRTTAENFARYFYDKLTECGYEVGKVAVYETPDNCAVYMSSV